MNAQIINNWGPAVMVCFTVIIGLFYSNQRLTDLRNDWKIHLELIYKRFDKIESELEIIKGDIKEFYKILREK